MTDQTNDPVAAAAQLEQQAAQPSSTEPSAPVVAQPDPTPMPAAGAVEPEPASQQAPESSAIVASTTEPPTTAGEDPNAAASLAGDERVVVTRSSVPPAPPVAATPGPSDSGVRERAMSAIAKLRSHFWTFEQSAVAHLHKELDILEHLVK